MSSLRNIQVILGVNLPQTNNALQLQTLVIDQILCRDVFVHCWVCSFQCIFFCLPLLGTKTCAVLFSIFCSEADRTQKSASVTLFKCPVEILARHTTGFQFVEDFTSAVIITVLSMFVTNCQPSGPFTIFNFAYQPANSERFWYVLMVMTRCTSLHTPKAQKGGPRINHAHSVVPIFHMAVALKGRKWFILKFHRKSFALGLFWAITCSCCCKQRSVEDGTILW